MSALGITVIVHGAQAAPPSAIEALVARLQGRAEARVTAKTAWGPTRDAHAWTTRLDSIVRTAATGHVLVVAMDASGRHVDIDGVVDALVARAGIVVGQRDGDVAGRLAPIAADAFLDLLTTVAAESPMARWWPERACEAWAIERHLFESLGGLDTSLSASVAVDDLCRRALAAGRPVEFVDLAGDVIDTLDLPGTHRAYLGIRDTLVSAALRGDANERGRKSALVIASAIARAWTACGVDPSILRFSGSWARQGAVDRLLATPGLREGDALWPRDVDGAMRPMLALDDALERLVARAHEAPRVTGETIASAHTEAAMTESPAVDATPRTPAATPEAPVVSVIIVNWNGREHLEPLFSSLRKSDHPGDRLDIICVDNGSTDDSRALVAASFPEVRVVALPENRGFTGGNVAGVDAARGSVLVFLNNDMRVEPDTIRKLVAGLDEAHPCTGACVLSWDGRRIDFLRGTASWEGRGFQEHFGEPRDTLPTIDTDTTFFPNGGAFAITRDAYDRAGGFDPAFFAYYDDLDLGWGLRVAGGHIRVVRDAIVYHRHGATGSTQPRGQKQFLLERNALWTIAKRYGNEALARALAPALLLACRRFVHDALFTATRDTASVPTAIALKRAPLERLAAIGEAVRGFPGIVATRRRLAAERRVPDRAVVSRMGRTLDALSSRTEYRLAQERLVEVFGLDAVLRARSRVLLLTHEPLRTSMSGPGVRVLELGRALAKHGAAVTIASPLTSDLREPTLTIAKHDGSDQGVMEMAAVHDVVVVQGFALESFPSLKQMPIVLVVDLYCPFTIEHLELRAGSTDAAPSAADVAQFAREAAGALLAQNRQLETGDYFICASERQRDFWLGALQTSGRLTLQTYGDDPSLRSLIDVVAFGLPDTPPPAKQRAVMKGVFPGIRQDDHVLLWAGSMLDWQDPQLLIRAVARLAQVRDDVKLVFMGTKHPNPDVSPMRAVPACRALADELGVTDRHVFFNDWVPYAERHEWLLEADLGVSTHRDHLETHFSFRTRMLDYLWAGLPIVCTDGDVFGELVAARGLGRVVPPGDEAALVDAIASLLDDDAERARCRERVASAARGMTWDQVARPLIRFCADPRQAADRRPLTERFHSRLKGQFRLTKWLKATAIRAGISDARLDQLKQTALVRQLMVLRNRRAYARARRG